MSSRIGILAPEIPSVSATFVYREADALRAAGERVATYSLRPGNDISPETAPHRRSTTVVYRARFHWLFDALGAIACRPIRSAATLALAGRDLLRGPFDRPGQRARVPVQALAGLALGQALLRDGVTHLHVHFAHAPATVGMYAARGAGIPFSIVGHARDLLVEGGLQRQKLERAAFFTTISEANRSELRRRHGAAADCVQVLRCGVDRARFQAASERAEQHEPVVLTVARLVPKKGVDRLIASFRGVLDDVPTARLVIAGDGPDADALVALAEREGIVDRVEFLGAVNGATVRRWLARATVFCLPCRRAPDGDRDGIPVALMEAMASGVPVVAGRVPGIEELVHDGRNGRLVEADVPGELEHALRTVMASEDLRRRFAAQGLAEIRERYDLHRNAAALAALVHRASRSAACALAPA